MRPGLTHGWRGNPEQALTLNPQSGSDSDLPVLYSEFYILYSSLFGRLQAPGGGNYE